MCEQHSASETYDISALNGMLRGELAAVDTYNFAIRKVDAAPILTELERIRDEHQSAVCALRQWMRDSRETSASSSGAWGFFASAVAGAAAVAGETTLLAVLKQGERHGEATYRQGMGNPDLPDDIRHLVGAKLLPQCQAHLAKLDRLSSS